VAKFRNISNDTLWVDLGNGQFPKVEPGEIVDIDDSVRYVQTGESGEVAIWERVAPPASVKKSAPAAASKE
jgi:hypothetical protein